MDQPQATHKNVQIQVSEEISQGIYSNLSIINHTDAEFVLDFVYLQPNVPKGKVLSRVIMTPEHAKRFMIAMQDNINKFEGKFGMIEAKNSISAKDISVK